MKNNLPKNTIWGRLVKSNKVGIEEIYMIKAKNGQGLMIGAGDVNWLLSFRAMENSERDSDYYYFESTASILAPMYELLRGGRITDTDTLRQYSAEKLEREGRFFLPAYFGELEAPADPHANEVIRIDNGVYNVKTPDKAYLAVHELCGENQLSDAARELGRLRHDYYYYNGPARVVPLYELSRTNGAAADFIGDKISAVQNTLRFNFPDYAKERGIEPPNPAVPKEQTRSYKFTNLIATYEEVFKIPQEQRLTYYFGDMGGHFLNRGVSEDDAAAAYAKGLQAIGMSSGGYMNNDAFIYRGNTAMLMYLKNNIPVPEFYTGQVSVSEFMNEHADLFAADAALFDADEDEPEM